MINDAGNGVNCASMNGFGPLPTSSIDIPAKRVNWKLAIGLPLLVITTCYFIPHSPVFVNRQNLLTNAILGDVLLTAPILYYLVIRKTGTSAWSIIRLFTICLLSAGFILNGVNNEVLHFIKIWISPLLEAGLIFFIARKFYVSNRNAKLSGLGNLDFLSHTRRIMKEVTGSERAGNILSSEIAVFYYAFAGGTANAVQKTTFTSHKKSGMVLVLGTFLSLFIIETIGVHFLIALWKSVVAWIFTGLSIYTCLQLFAHIRALRMRPSRIHLDSVELHNGLAADAIIDLNNISEAILSKKNIEGGCQVKLSLINGLEPHNVIIRTKRPVTVTKIFGIQKPADTILFFVDSPEEFIETLKQANISAQ
jgi:hypothetical protein